MTLNPYNSKKDGLFFKIFEFFIYELIIFASYFFSLRLDLFNGYDARNYDAFCNTIPWLMCAALFVFLFTGLFNTVNKSRSENIAIITIVVTILSILYMALAFMLRGFALPRTVILMAYLIQIFFFTGTKMIFLRMIRIRKGKRKTMIIAPLKEKETLVPKIVGSRYNKERLSFYVDPFLQPSFLKYVDKVDKIYLSDSVENHIKDKVISHCISMDKSLYMIPKTFEIAIFHSTLMQVSDIPMFRIDSLYLSWEQVIIKRIFDLGIGLLMLFVLAPIMIITAVVIMIFEGRPVLYTQERVTINNRPFKLYKFRSMKVNAERDTGAIWAIENDPRITPLGRFLRKFWLDELPQLFNVIKGDMSLVGPRPERPFFIEQFAKEIPDFHYRLSVKAGVTGLAQVLGKYATSPENKIKYDLLYIKNSNIMFDFKILFETLKKIIMGTLKRGENKDYNYEEFLKYKSYSEKYKNGIIEYR